MQNSTCPYARPQPQCLTEKQRIYMWMARIDFTRVTGPLDRSAMMAELHIENPLVADMVQKWYSIRQSRIRFEQAMFPKIEAAQAELAKFQSEQRRQAELDFECEDNWEDVEEDDDMDAE